MFPKVYTVGAFKHNEAVGQYKGNLSRGTNECPPPLHVSVHQQVWTLTDCPHYEANSAHDSDFTENRTTTKWCLALWLILSYIKLALVGKRSLWQCCQAVIRKSIQKCAVSLLRPVLKSWSRCLLLWNCLQAWESSVRVGSQCLNIHMQGCILDLCISVCVLVYSGPVQKMSYNCTADPTEPVRFLSSSKFQFSLNP